MKTIKDITIEEVQDLFDSVIFLRGEDYHRCSGFYWWLRIYSCSGLA
jgi:hypothetical protein